MSSVSVGEAQLRGIEGSYQPMHQNMPPGAAGYWAGALGKGRPNYSQPIRITLPSQGKVTVYPGGDSAPHTLTAPALVGVGVGHFYRFRISDMPEFPGVDVYPSVEILDQLHPPVGQANAFPIPIEIHRDELEMVLEGRMVTKVIYLEQPNMASPRAHTGRVPVSTLEAQRNLLAAADQIGRPMVILRIGGRQPDPRQMNSEFFGRGAPLKVLSQTMPSSNNIIPSGYEDNSEFALEQQLPSQSSSFPNRSSSDIRMGGATSTGAFFR